MAAAFDHGIFDAVVVMVICTTVFSKEAAIPTVLISIIQNLPAPIIVRFQKTDLDFRLGSPRPPMKLKSQKNWTNRF